MKIYLKQKIYMQMHLSTHLCLMAFMVDFPKLMEISSSNSVNDYSTNSLAPNILYWHEGRRVWWVMRGK